MQKDITENNGLLSIGDASEYLGISIDTLRRWEKKGKLISLRSPGGHRYFKKEDLDTVFGRKYERDPETKPRNIAVSDKIEEPHSDLPVEDLSTSAELVNSPSENINAVPEIPKTVVPEPEEKPENQSFDPSVNYDLGVVDFFPSSDTSSFIPEVNDIKIPQINPIQVVQKEDINIDSNANQDIKQEQEKVAEISPENSSYESILNPVSAPPAKETTPAVVEDKILEPPELPQSKKGGREKNGSNILFIILGLVAVITVVVLTILYIQIPEVPISPIP